MVVVAHPGKEAGAVDRTSAVSEPTAATVGIASDGSTLVV